MKRTIPYKPSDLELDEWREALQKRLKKILFHGQANEAKKNNSDYYSSRALYLCGLVQAELEESGNVTVHILPTLLHKR